MIAKEDRILAVGKEEYRIRKNQDVSHLPKHVINDLIELGLVNKPRKTKKKSGRRKSNVKKSTD